LADEPPSIDSPLPLPPACRVTRYASRRGRPGRRSSPRIGSKTASNSESWLMKIGSVSLASLPA
jgi:hypothetical protein